MSFNFTVGSGKTDVGQKRTNNEDSLWFDQDYGLYAVADGIGGASVGEIASARVVDMLQRLPAEKPDINFEEKITAVCQQINDASQWIRNYTNQLNLKVSGTTFSGLIFDAEMPGRGISLHAGDSRLYRLRGEDFDCLTDDHCLSNELGADVPAQYKSVITRAVGVKESVNIEATEVDVKAMDTFLLCTDGLCNMVSDETIYNYLKESHGTVPIDEQVTELIEKANQAGGFDNITAIIVQILPTIGVDFSDGWGEDAPAQIEALMNKG